MKPLTWMGSSLKDVRDFPEEVKDVVGHALQEVQFGRKPLSARTLTGFGGGGVLEVIEDFQTDTYRVVYTVEFQRVVYVLHVFKKKSKKGVRTPREDLETIRLRLRWAEELDRSRRMVVGEVTKDDD